MHVGIDASNLRFGGGVTHLVQLLDAADPVRDGFGRVTVWSGGATAARLPERAWLDVVTPPALDRPLPFRAAWQRIRLEGAARAAGADVLLVPGGTYRGGFRPFVTMCRNLAPWDEAVARLYGPSWWRLRLALLRRSQGATFRRADGVIFLTETARRIVLDRLDELGGRQAIVPHGLARRFFMEPRPQRPPEAFGEARPFRWLYVSTVDGYKHQPEAARAVARLREEGHPVTLDLVGHAVEPYETRLRRALAELDPAGETVRYLGSLPFEALHRAYHDADGFLFASSCENLPNILLEAMAAGLPVACSDRGVMPEVLGPAGVYFDPRDPGAIAAALVRLMEDPELRARLAAEGQARARGYSWPLCAERTFAFLREVAGVEAACAR